jgi:hypothetical protein
VSAIQRKSSLTFRALRTASRTPSTLTLFNNIKPGTNRANYVSILLEAEKLAARTKKEEEERLAAESEAAVVAGVKGLVVTEEVKSEESPKDADGGATMKEEEVKVTVAEMGEGEGEIGGAVEAKEAKEEEAVPSVSEAISQTAEETSPEGTSVADVKVEEDAPPASAPEAAPVTDVEMTT